MAKNENDQELADFQPPKKKACGSKRVEAKSSTRFKSRSDQEMEVLAKGFIPANTQRNTGWAMRDWKAERSKNYADDAEKCPDDLLNNPESRKVELLAFVICG